MHIFRIQLAKELRELWRTKKLLIVVAVLVLFGLMSPVLAKITPDLLESMGENQMQGVTITIPEPTQKDAIDQFVKNTTQFGLLLAVLMSFGVIVGEKERGQAALMLPHPLPRPVFVLAKFAALAILFALGLILAGLGAYIYTVLLFSAPDAGGFVAMIVLLYVWLLTLVGVSVLASTLGRSMTGAGGLAFLFVVVLLLSSVFTHLAPGELTGWGSALAAGTGGPDRWGALSASLLTTVLAVGASCLVLQRQEIG